GRGGGGGAGAAGRAACPGRLGRPAAAAQFLPARARTHAGHHPGHVPDGGGVDHLLLGAARSPGAARDPDRRVPDGHHADHADAAGARGPVPRPRGRLGARAAVAAARVTGLQPVTITASTSNAAPLGRAETSIVERAGYGAWKYSAITALTAANCARLVRYRPARAMSSNEPPAASQTARRFSKARRACMPMSPSTSSPVAGSSGIWPEK